jgi:hypothetical protein
MNPQQTPPMALPRPSKKPLIAAVVLGVLLVLALAFGAWAFTGRQDYKNKAAQKIAAAVEAAKKDQAAQLQAQFNEQSKSPYKTFAGPATFGSVSFKYPKTWSAYIDQTNSSEPINGYFYPNQVPGTSSNTAFALRVELVGDDYADIVEQLQSSVQDGSLKASAYTPPRMKGVANAQVGTRFVGELGEDSNGSPINGAMVVLKVRDKTLQVYTQSQSYVDDFNKIILANLKYVP